MTISSAHSLSLGAFLLIGLCMLSTLLFAQASQLQSEVSSSAFGNCSAPKTAGVSICAPFIFPNVTSIATPFQLIASGTGSGGAVRLMEVFIDGKKVAQASGNLFDSPVNVAIGTHRLVVVELDTSGAFRKSAPITIFIVGSTVGETCAPPGSPGVNDCSPGVGSCNVSGWTSIIASGTGASGTVRRMELWDGNIKIANFPGDFINTNMYFFDFSKLQIIEVDSKGAFVKSPIIITQAC